ncbi:MAG: DUF11 domain-containing protein [Chloroflexota bacterium]
MRENSEAPAQTHKNKRGVLLVSLVSAFALMLVVVGLSGADEGPDRRPTPEPGAKIEISPYSGVVSSTLELLAEEPSIERYVAGQSIPADMLLPANLAESSKTVSPEEAPPNGVVEFTITVVNDGNTDALTTVTDKLPNGLSYVSSECEALLTTTCEENNGTVTWEGTAIAGQEVVITITAHVDEDVEAGTNIKNTAEIVTDGDTIERSATVEVVEMIGSPIQFLPFTLYGLQPDPQPVQLTAGSPNGNNEWTVSWSESLGATGYELQESKAEDFNGATSYMVSGSDSSLKIKQNPSPRNIFYYRVRSLVGETAGPWSNIESVVGGYLDTFDSTDTGWAIRRTTYKEEVRSFYEPQDSWFVIQVEDRWDWGISSPGMPAPRLPYVISYDVWIANTANLLSSGFVFGGDWPGDQCPSDPDSYDGIYKHTECFNHFYNTNVIFYSWLKMLFERVDQLVWCSDCGGSPMKRLGDIDPNSAKDLKGVEPEGWNSYRIEVREDGIKIFAAKRGSPLQLQKEYSDTRWVHDPYFGVFASTDEYNNSTWRYDNVLVMPLDE